MRTEITRPDYERTGCRYVRDATGLLVGLAVHGADIKDRGGAPSVLDSIRDAFPGLRHIFADGGYGNRDGHAALSRRTVPDVDQGIRGLLHVGVSRSPTRDLPRNPGCR